MRLHLKSRFSQHRSSSSPSLMTKWWLFFQCIGGHSKRSFLVWLIIISYSLGAFYAYSVFNYDPSDRQNIGDSFRRRESDFQDEKDQQFNFQFNEDRKRILLWTKFYKEDTLTSYCIRPDTLRQCPYSKCEFTTDKKLLRSSDAVVFHGRDLSGQRTIEGFSDKYIEMPRYRSEYQSWIFLMFEAPVHTWINLEPFDNDFNMTMTYRSDSDIYIPYGRVIPVQMTSDQNDVSLNNSPGKVFKEFSTKKKRLVAWSVSNCYKTPSRRNEVVHELHKYISIDIYGDCGSYNCTPYLSLCDSGLVCHQYLAEKYKFYLAFENSLCTEYITEKFFDSLYVGMVPIVYGGHGYGDYSRVAPKGSYIDASVFPTMKSLADYLHYLDSHPLEYEKYFEWKEHFRVTISYFDDAWCSLCTKLWTSTVNSSSTPRSPTTENNLWSSSSTGSKTKIDIVRRQVKNLTDWWFHKQSNATYGNLKENACLSPTQLKWDSNIFSFYGFIYYPNYSVKIGVMYGLFFILISALLLCILRSIRIRILYKDRGN